MKNDTEKNQVEHATEDEGRSNSSLSYLTLYYWPSKSYI